MSCGRIPLYPGGCDRDDCVRMPLFGGEWRHCGAGNAACDGACQVVRICNPACPGEYADVELCVDHCGNLSICVRRPPKDVCVRRRGCIGRR